MVCRIASEVRVSVSPLIPTSSISAPRPPKSTFESLPEVHATAAVGQPPQEAPLTVAHMLHTFGVPKWDHGGPEVSGNGSKVMSHLPQKPLVVGVSDRKWVGFARECPLQVFGL